MKMQTSSIRYEDSDPWYVRYQDQIGVPIMGILFGIMFMLPFFFG